VFKAFSQYSLLQEMSAPIISSWSFAYHGLYTFIGDCLCTVYFHEAKPVYFTIHRPPGPCLSLARIIDALYGLCREAGLPFLQIRFVDERYLTGFEEIPGCRLETRRHPQDDEYAYRPEDLLRLSGAANFYKRRRIRRCSAMEGVSLRPLTRANAGECLAVEDAWCRGKDCVSCASFGGCEREALRNMVEIFDERRHTGLLLYLGEERAGYVICERINEKLAFLYFGKAVVEGFFVFLIYSLFTEPHTSEILKGLEYLNINEDMGSPGLRLFKSHLSVHELWPKYICTYTGEGPDSSDGDRSGGAVSGISFSPAGALH
jgi:hypothetical protein